jgi:uncharacterized RDD family membrane protein YckC
VTWQGDGGTGPAGEGPDDETRVDVPATGAEVIQQPPTPPVAPPLAPPAPPPAFDGPSYPPPAAGWAPPASSVAGAGPGSGGLKYGGVLARWLAWVLDGFVLSILLLVVSAFMGGLMRDTYGAVLVSTVVYVGATFLYFVGMWTAARQATLGMRVFNLRVGNAADGQPLTMTQAVIRWLALGLWVNFAAVLPAPASTSVSVLGLLWYLVLLVSTVASPTRQGIHDRVAGSSIVQPIGREGPVMPCLLVMVLLVVVLPIVAIVTLIFLGGAVEEILREVGTSI